jgi:hypothetical protein
MIRNLIASFMLAGSIAALATSQAKAQSPDPALLAPPAAQAGLAPPSVLSEPAPRYAVPAPRPGGNTVRARTRATSRSRAWLSQSHAGDQGEEFDGHQSDRMRRTAPPSH